MLGQDHGALRIPHLPNDRRDVGTKLGKRANVFSELDFGHDTLYKQSTIISTVYRT